MYKNLCLLLLCLIGTTIHAQNYEKVDSYARSIKRAGRNSEKIAKKLTEPFELETEKARAIFIWITENIAYDCKLYHEGMKRKPLKITGKTEAEVASIINNMRLKRIRRAMAKGKGVCQEYSELFQQMCQYVGIKAEFITGFTKSSPHKIGLKVKKSDHAWNAVYLDEKWYLLDATWAAGNTDDKVTKFHKKYTEAYYLTDPATFLLSHFPDDPKWLLIDTTITLDSFQLFPLTFLGVYEAELQDFHPKEGIIPYVDGGSVRFQLAFKDNNLIENVLLIEGKDKVVGQFVFDGDFFELDYDLSGKNQRVLTLVIDYLYEGQKATSRLLAYKVKTVK